MLLLISLFHLHFFNRIKRSTSLRKPGWRNPSTARWASPCSTSWLYSCGHCVFRHILARSWLSSWQMGRSVLVFFLQNFHSNVYSVGFILVLHSEPANCVTASAGVPNEVHSRRGAGKCSHGDTLNPLPGEQAFTGRACQDRLCGALMNTSRLLLRRS